MSDFDKIDKIPIEGVGIDEEFHGKFPTDAFVFDKISVTNPKLRLVNPWCYSAPKHILEKSANYIVLDTDGSCTILVTTGASTITITLPTLADNRGVNIEIIKVDSGAGKVIIDGEGSEVIYNQYASFLTIELWLQYSIIKIISDKTQWIKTNSPYLHLLDESSRAASYNISANPTTSWVEYDSSSAVPSGTLGLYGWFLSVATDANGNLKFRDGTSSETDNIRLFSYDIGYAASIRSGVPIMIKATNGIFDIQELSSANEVAAIRFDIWGWLL